MNMKVFLNFLIMNETLSEAKKVIMHGKVCTMKELTSRIPQSITTAKHLAIVLVLMEKKWPTKACFHSTVGKEEAILSPNIRSCIARRMTLPALPILQTKLSVHRRYIIMRNTNGLRQRRQKKQHTVGTLS